MGIGDGAIAVVPLSTRVTMHLLGGKRACAIKGQKGVARDKDHLLQGFATVRSAKNMGKQWTEALGLNGVEDLTKGGHQDIRQGKRRCARTRLGQGSKAAAEQAEQSVSGQILVRLRNGHDPHTLQEKTCQWLR